MAFLPKVMCRGVLQASKELFERQVILGGVTTFNGGLNIDINHSPVILPQRDFSTKNIISSSANMMHLYDQQVLSPVNSNVNAKRCYHPNENKIKRKNERREKDASDDESDDEFERKRKDLQNKMSERGDSEFWRRKMRTLHRIFDVNRDGVISFEDFKLLAKRFTDLGHLSPELSEEFLHVMQQTWEEQFGEISPYKLISAEQFLTDIHHRLNDKEMVKRIGRFLPYIFKAVDYDHTGHLNIEQYKLFFRCLGLTDEDAAISFAVIDKNGDGQVSMKEFVHLGRQFFLTEDDRKISRMFWGPLIDH